MKRKRILSLFIVLLGIFLKGNAQDIELYQQFNGRYDFTFIGNTMNTEANGFFTPCYALTSSSATLNLNVNDQIEKVFLYWAGSGTGDFDIQLNDVDISSQINFTAIQNSSLNHFFSAFADVTQQVLTTGNGIYTVSELDINPFIDSDTYCNNATNFAGWAMLIVYKNTTLPINQINVYHGLQALSAAVVNVQTQITITLSALNVLDNNGAKLGFIAWEGDENIANQESVYINNDLLANPPLNPGNNIFNGTNSITQSSDLYNMDLDIFDIQGNIQVGDQSLDISLTTAQDFVLINTLVTKLNNQLPDATISIDTVEKTCDSKIITVDFTVYNSNSTNELPAGTPIAIYANDEFIEFSETILPIEIDGSWSSQITITLPENIPDTFTLQFVVDDSGQGIGHVAELIETNNSFSVEMTLIKTPTFNALEPITSCNEGFTSGTFDFSNYQELVKSIPSGAVHFYETFENATDNVNPILTPSNYSANATPKEIFIRIENENCFSITSFLLLTKNCPPTVYNYISANDDTINDVFTIEGLRNIFLEFKIEIYNRWGRLLWTGNQNTEDWNGYVKDGISIKKATDGTYFYLIFLNDIDYPQPLTGFLYINH